MAWKTLICLALASQAIPGWSQDAQVLIIGSQTDTEARRDFIAGTIVIGRKRIEDSGTRTVAELLKREPAVTVREGRISLLNMPGYTQILIDGHAPQSAISPGDLNLIHVEQIEIIKSSSAQFGPFGIAGTINIISRKTARKTTTVMTTGAARGGGQREANLSLSHTQSTTGSPLQYSVRMSADREDSSHDGVATQTLEQHGAGEQVQWLALNSERMLSTSLVVNGNVLLQTTGAGKFSSSPEVVRRGDDNGQTEGREWLNKSTLMLQDRSGSTLKSILLPLTWTFKPTRKSQLEFGATSYHSRFETDQTLTHAVSGEANAVRDVILLSSGKSKNFKLDYKVTISGGHAIKAGASFLRTDSRDTYDERLNGLPDTALNALGRFRRSSSQQRRFYLQDEWRISESIASTLGVSGGQDSVDLKGSDHVVGTRFQVWSPSLHLSKKLGGDDKKQLRLSLARSFKAAAEEDLTRRPEINTMAPCWSARICLANTIDTADTAGNFRLQPERALALNISYEYGMGDDSQLSFEIFKRHISGKQGDQIVLESVTWSDAPRYVSRPTNLGVAHVTGINVGIELALQDAFKGAPSVTVRGNLGLARSRVVDLPGPDNHLKKLTPWTAKIGGTYDLNKLAPIKIDLDANWSPGLWTRTSQSERVFAPRSFEGDFSLIWGINKNSSFVVGLTTKYPRTKQSINEYFAGDQLVRLYTAEKRGARLKLQFETKL